MSETALIEILEEMEVAAKDLQGNLISRNTDGIWSSLRKQEKAVAGLAAVSNESTRELTGASRSSPHIRKLLERSQSLLRTNRALTRTFLQMIDRTLGHLSGSDTPAYTGYGNVMTSGRPLLVSQLG